MKKMNNKGFSLVELIIVIAIMAVLIGVLAPQYLKYVNNSKVSTDIQNAQALATAVNVAIADGNTLGTSYSGAGGTTMSIPGVSATMWPVSKYDSNYSWTITLDGNGVSEITLGSKHIYPNPDGASSYASLMN